MILEIFERAKNGVPATQANILSSYPNLRGAWRFKFLS
jgi:hypothetical protein